MIVKNATLLLLFLILFHSVSSAQADDSLINKFGRVNFIMAAGAGNHSSIAAEFEYKLKENKNKKHFIGLKGGLWTFFDLLGNLDLNYGRYLGLNYHYLYGKENDNIFLELEGGLFYIT